MTAVREGPEGIPAVGVEEVRLWGLRSVSQELYRYCIILIYVHLHCYANESKFLGSPFVLDLSKDGDKANSTPPCAQAGSRGTILWVSNRTCTVHVHAGSRR